MVASYAYIYNNVSEQVPTNGNITFNTIASATSDIVYNNGIITLTNAGVYKISYYLQTDGSNQLALFLNNTILNGSIYSTNVSTTHQLNLGTIITNINSNNTLSLRNITPSTINISAISLGANTSINASITIEKLA